MGDRDFVEPLLEKLRTVHMKPGKPLTFATIETPSDKTDSAAQLHRTIVFGLPGNPAHISSALRLDPDRPEYHGASLRWEPNVPAALASSAASLPSSAGSTAAVLPLAPLCLELLQAHGSFPAGSVLSALFLPDAAACLTVPAMAVGRTGETVAVRGGGEGGEGETHGEVQAVQSFLRAAAVVTTVVVPDDPDKIAAQAEPKDHALLHMVAENRGSTLWLADDTLHDTCEGPSVHAPWPFLEYHHGPPVMMRAVGGDGALPRYSQEELRRATGDWRTKLGEGGFGAVYKGMLLLPQGGGGGDGEDGEDGENGEGEGERRGGGGGGGGRGGGGGEGGGGKEGEGGEWDGEGDEGEESEAEGGMGIEGLEVVEVGGMEFVPVAVKLCLTDDVESGAREQLLVSNGHERVTHEHLPEIMMMTALHHPNVLRVLGMTLMGRKLAMVSEFVPGGDVSQRLQKAAKGTEPFPWKERLRIARGSLEGLAAIHREGFIHRDFKAANVLLTKTLVPKVADFGLAKACQDKTHVTTRVAGLMGYMDPSYFERGEPAWCVF
ncbi:unnamed protein product [Closterium sp. NIES-64]|nr:unnamed protein product [Closterium sp. NIES-64]